MQALNTALLFLNNLRKDCSHMDFERLRPEEAFLFSIDMSASLLLRQPDTRIGGSI